jgi:hypothetical protein
VKPVEQAFRDEAEQEMRQCQDAVVVAAVASTAAPGQDAAEPRVWRQVDPQEAVAAPKGAGRSALPESDLARQVLPEVEKVALE